MKVLGIGGSLRENSNSLYLLNVAMEELKQTGMETEIISLRDKKVEPCTGCYDCREAHVCTIVSDDFNEIFGKMMEAKGLILSSPVYVSSVTPPMMNVLCRAAFVAHWGGKMFMGKVGGPITVAQRAGHNTALSQLLLWFFFNGITVPGSIYWNIGVAGTGGAHDAEKDALGIQTIKAFSKNMSGIMNKLFV
jgi:multimeric flavodoxin WrbA